jgi:hypothetical protein
MKLLYVVFVAASLMTVAGCEVRERTVEDPHRQWWAEHHGQEAYDRSRAEREHRDWCAHSPDQSCRGWR